jgi:hypothetical protein
MPLQLVQRLISIVKMINHRNGRRHHIDRRNYHNGENNYENNYGNGSN